MATGVQPQGFVSKTQPEIVADITAQATSPEFFGENFPTTPDSVAGNLFQIIAAAIKDSGWDLAESVYNQFNRDKAEGKNLDDLAALIGLTRLQDAGSVGQLLFKGSPGGVVPANTAVSDNDNRYVTTTDTVTYDRGSCYEVRVSVANVLDNTTYTIDVEGTPFNYLSGVGATEELIIEGLRVAIGNQPTYTASTEDSQTTLVVTLNSFNNTLTVNTGTNLTLFNVSALVSAISEEKGALSYPAGTLTRLSPVPVGTVDVTNPADFSLGRLEETDEELRQRMADRESSTGTATKPAIESSISEISGVSSVLVIENATLTTDSSGIPAKAYETFVTGGDEDTIASVVWETKPAGIATHGTITKIIIDRNGDEQVVKFSRPLLKYATVRVTYTLYDEERFPSNGEEVMKATINDYGNSLQAGEDLIPQRFNGQLFNAVDGLLSVVTEIGISATPNTPPAGFTTNPIPVADSESVDFNLDRITVSL